MKCSSRKLFLEDSKTFSFFFKRPLKKINHHLGSCKPPKQLLVFVCYSLCFKAKTTRQAHAGSVKLFIAIQWYHVIANLRPEGTLVTSKGNGTWNSTRAWIKWAECVNWQKSGTNSELANCACPAVCFPPLSAFPLVLDWDMRRTGRHIRARTCKIYMTISVTPRYLHV